jgi:hypothetical protein
VEDPGRPAEPDLAGLRDRALLLVGFWGALRRSALAALTRTGSPNTPWRRAVTGQRSEWLARSNGEGEHHVRG